MSASPDHPPRSFRFLFMCDFHLMRQHHAPEGMVKALTAATAMDPKPAFIVTGGDLCHELRHQTREQGTDLAELFATLWERHVTIPAYHSLGNHFRASTHSSALISSKPN